MSPSGAEFPTEVNRTDSQISEAAEDSKPQATYDRNIELIESLNEMEAKNERLKKREMFWKKGGLALAVAPLLAGCVLIASPEGRKLGFDKKIETGVFGFVGSIIVGGTALNRFDKNRGKGQGLAEKALPLSHELNNSTRPWIASRFAEKEADELRARRNRGLAK